MRKLTSAADDDGRFLQPNFMSPPLIAPSISPSPSESHVRPRQPLFFFSPVPILDGAIDFVSLSVIAGILLLSLLSLCFIIHLRLKSRSSRHLQNFNSLWTVRLLLVSFVSMWALNEILRLPFFHRRYLYPFLPPLTLVQQSGICKMYLVLSLGLFEPGFLVTLLFLVNASVKRRLPGQFRFVSSVFFACLPAVILQLFFVFMSPLEAKLPPVFRRSSVLLVDAFGNRSVMCTYPLLSTIAFASFAVVYGLGLMVSCWRVVTFVINKGIRTRIRVLALTVMVTLSVQIVMLGTSSFWTPGSLVYGGVVTVMFAGVTVCAAVGEGILVIKPIVEALSAGGDCLRCSPADRRRVGE